MNNTAKPDNKFDIKRPIVVLKTRYMLIEFSEGVGIHVSGKGFIVDKPYKKRNIRGNSKM